MEERTIYANYDENIIRVYQAYNADIAEEALMLGTFGKNFSLSRMTWIKPSFLWMMYRSGWASKENQERILAIDMKREGFDEILENAILSSYSKESKISMEEWRKKIKQSEVRCQWDPERDIFGNPVGRRSLQLGIRGEVLKKYVEDWIVSITDITEEVKRIKENIDNQTFSMDSLPDEKIYTIKG